MNAQTFQSRVLPLLYALAQVTGLWPLLLALMTTIPAQGLTWHTDFEQARQTAIEQNKPLFVLIHQAGESGNEGMIEAVYRNPRLAKELDGFIPFLACSFQEGDGERAARAFGVASHHDLARGERAVRKALFGFGIEVPTPQHLFLHPSGGVLWHNIRVCGLQKILEGATAARKTMRQSAPRTGRPDAELAQLAKSARREVEPYIKLLARARWGTDQDFAAAVKATEATPDLAERLLGDAACDIDFESGRRRLGSLRGTKLAPVCERLIDNLTAEAAGRNQVRPMSAPPPVLGKLDLSKVTFADGKARTAECVDALTVLWIFLPNDPMAEAWGKELRAVVDELAPRGVRFLGACAVTPPETSSEHGSAAGLTTLTELPFPTGTFDFDANAPWLRIGFFPAALIVEPDGDVIFRSTDDPATKDKWMSFAPWVRGFLALPTEPRPSPSGAR